MTEKLDAKLDQAKGSVKEAIGKLTDHKKLEAEGLVDKIAGKAKEVVADVKDTIDGVREGIKNHTEDEDQVN